MILTIAFARGAFIVLAIPIFVILVALLQSDRGPIAYLLNTGPAQYLGRISYSIYMVHTPVVLCILIVLRRMELTVDLSISIRTWLGDILVLAAILAVLGTATVTYFFIEEPGRLFGRRIAGRRIK